MIMSVSINSRILQTGVELSVIMPYDTLKEKRDKKPCVLYLLHGLHGMHNSYLANSNIARYVKNKNVCVVMPSMGNTFYVNNAYGIKYLDFMAYELPEYIENTFVVSTKREDNFVCGLSMGGYGAMRIAFERNEKFAAAASLSGALDIAAISKNAANGFDEAVINAFKINFGENGVSYGEENDLFCLAKKVSECKVKPKILQYCGKQDYLYDINKGFKNYIEKLDFEYKYYESNGIHNWDFWDETIKLVIEEFEKISGNF